MRDLCRRLGVSHNLLHQRFGSKDRLWYTAVDHGFSALATDLVLRALAERFGDAPKTDDEVRRYATASSTSCCRASAPALPPTDLDGRQ